MNRLIYLFFVCVDFVSSSLWTRLLGGTVFCLSVYLLWRWESVKKLNGLIAKIKVELVAVKQNPQRYQETLSWKIGLLKQRIREEKAKGVKSFFKRLVFVAPAFFMLTIGVLLFHLIYAIPFVNRQRKRFQKEMKPVFYFKSIKSLFVMGGIGTFLAALMTNYIVHVLRGLIGLFAKAAIQVFQRNGAPLSMGTIHLFPVFYAWHLLDFTVYRVAPILAIPLFLLFVVVGWKSSWINFEQYRNYNSNEAGDDEFIDIPDIVRQYQKIPDKKLPFEGHGGLPIAHVNSKTVQGFSLGAKMKWRNKKFTMILTNAEKVLGRADKPTGYYFIETETKNAIYIGMTRSGKGETIINPTIDIISRASIPSSMIISDAKGELYQAAYDTLRKRGFDVEVLNFQDMDFSMSYNPLELAIQAAKKGYYEKTQRLVNAVAESIYRKGSEVDPKNAFWENSAIGLFNAITIALIDRANETVKNGEVDAWETITIRNVAKFITDLGSETVLVDSEGNIVDQPVKGQLILQKTKLTLYFENLRKINQHQFSKFREMADINFSASNFASEETKGNIYASMISDLGLYLQDDVAKITSKNSIDLESVGNPRRLSIKFRTSSSREQKNRYCFQTASINIYGKEGRGLNKKESHLVKNASAIVDGEGYLNYIIVPKLPDAFRMTIDFSHPNNTETDILTHTYEFQGKKVYQTKGLRKVKDSYTKQPILDHVATTIVAQPQKDCVLEPTNIEMIYSDKPKAIFLVTPPNRSEYNAISSFFINQLFNTIYDSALITEGRKTANRIQFILDEFCNIPTIPEMDQKLSIGLGQNIQFMLFVQNIGQMIKKYGKEVTESMMGNCSINEYLKSTDPTTLEGYSKALGKRTITKRAKSGNVLDESNPNIRYESGDQELLTESELGKLQSGEAVIIRGIKDQDNAGRNVITDPIFVSGKTALPHRYMFLSNEFDQSKKLSDIPVESRHRGMNLKDVALEAPETFENIIQWRNDLEAGSFQTEHGEAKLMGRTRPA